MSASPEPSRPSVQTGPAVSAPVAEAVAGRLSWAAIGIILLYGASLYSFGLLWPRTLTFHETIFAQPAREMVATGNWLVPMYAGQVWDDKPPLTCWLIASAMTVFHSRYEAVVHLPNILVTLAAALLMGVLTARWYGSKAGLLAGLVQLTTFYTLVQGRLAEADMPLGVAVLGAMTVFALANIESPAGLIARWWMPVLFYFCTGLAFLAKGPIGPAFVGLGCGLFALWRWKWRIWRFLLDPLGWAVFLFFVLAWPIAVWRSNPEIAAGWFSQNVGRFSGQLSDTAEPQPFFFYFYMVPLLLLPWTPTLVWGLWSRWQEKTPKGEVESKEQRIERGEEKVENQSSALSPQSSPTPNPQPPTPASPLGNRQSEIGNLQSPDHPITRSPDNYLWRLLFCWFIVGFVLLCLSSWKARHYSIPILFTATPIIAWRLWQDVQKFTKNPPKALLGGFAAIWAVCVLVELLIQPHFDDYKYQAQLARRINQLVPAGETLYFLTGDHRPHLAYYLERPMQVVEDQQAFGEKIKTGQAAGRYVITQQMSLEWFRSLTPYQKLDQTSQRRPNENPMFQQTLIRLSVPATTTPATQAR